MLSQPQTVWPFAISVACAAPPLSLFYTRKEMSLHYVSKPLDLIMFLFVYENWWKCDSYTLITQFWLGTWDENQ